MRPNFTSTENPTSKSRTTSSPKAFLSNPSTTARSVEIKQTKNTEKRVKEIGDSNLYSSKRSNSELKTLSSLLNQTLDFFKENSQGNHRDGIKPAAEDIPDKAITPSEPELISVNIWNNVGGKLILSGKKPMLRETFQKIRREQNKTNKFVSLPRLIENKFVFK